VLQVQLSELEQDLLAKNFGKPPRSQISLLARLPVEESKITGVTGNGTAETPFSPRSRRVFAERTARTARTERAERIEFDRNPAIVRRRRPMRPGQVNAGTRARRVRRRADAPRKGRRTLCAGDDRLWAWLDAGAELRERADRLERTAEAVFAPFGLNLLEFLILRATDTLCRTLGDAVSQKQIAAEVGIGKMRTSRAMRALARRRLVDRGPSAMGLAYRVVVTTRGRNALRACRSHLAASLAALEIAGSG
jgi:DNA-binding MarR family transcriptional regulator